MKTQNSITLTHDEWSRNSICIPKIPFYFFAVRILINENIPKQLLHLRIQMNFSFKLSEREKKKSHKKVQMAERHLSGDEDVIRIFFRPS